MHERIKRLIDRIDNAAACPDDTPDTRLQKTLVIFLSAAGILLVPPLSPTTHSQASASTVDSRTTARFTSTMPKMLRSRFHSSLNSGKFMSSVTRLSIPPPAGENLM